MLWSSKNDKKSDESNIKVVHMMYILLILVLMHSFPIYIHAQLSFDSSCMHVYGTLVILYVKKQREHSSKYILCSATE